MLTKKQLEDVTRCKNIQCDECSCSIKNNCVAWNGDVVPSEVARTALAYREGLDKQRILINTLNNLGGLGYDKHRWLRDGISDIDKLLND